MAESNTDNSGVAKNKSGSVRERIEANARARKTLRERIDKVVDNQAPGVNTQTEAQVLPVVDKTDSKKKRRVFGANVKMIAIIVATVLVLVGLIVSVVVVNNNMNDEQESAQDEGEDSESGEDGDGGDSDGESDGCPGGDTDGEAEDDLIEVENVPGLIENTVDEAESLPQQEAVEYLREKLDEYIGTTAEFGMRMTLIFQYVRIGDADSALIVAEEIDPDKLDNEQKLDYLNAMAKINYALGDSAMGEWYQIQYGSLYEAIYGGISG